MTYERFEDLPVWQEAIELAEGCDDFLLAAKDNISWSKRDQLERASLSVSNNIAEGFERGTTSELLYFLYIARGSAGEVRSMLCYFELRPALKDFKFEIICRILFKAAQSVGRFFAELRDQRAKTLNSSFKRKFPQAKTK